MRAGPNIGDIPSIFPVIREFHQRRAVRCRLPGQPAARSGPSSSLWAMALAGLTACARAPWA